MSLNFSHRPVFAGHLLEDNLVDPVWVSNGGGYLVEDNPENNVDVFGNPWYLSREVEDHGRERWDRSGSQQLVSKDIVDLLPSDPFGMDISSTFTAITGWLEDLEAGYGWYGSSGEYQLFAGLNFIWNNAMQFRAFQGNMSFNFQHNANSWYGGCSENASFPIGFGSGCSMEGLSSGDSSMKMVGDVSCPTGFRSHVEDIDNGYCSTENGVGDVLCPIALGSAYSMEGTTSKYFSEEKGVVDVSCPIGFGAACRMDEVAIEYGGCSEGIEVRGSSCPVGFGPTCNIEEITSGCGYGGCSAEKVVVCDYMEDITSGFSDEKTIEDVPCSVGYMEGILSHENDRTQYQTEDQQEGCGGVVEACLGEAPRLVLGLVIGYLGVRDLLSVENVCKYLRATVRSEPYLWTRIHIDRPLNEKITDELLLQLTDKAQGELQCLSLLDCTRITDDGLKRVLESNPKLTKLNVPGCSKLSIEGIVNNLKSFKSMGGVGIKQLKIGTLYGVENYFEELQRLLGVHSNILKKTHTQHFFHTRHVYLLCDEDDDRALDIEMCPKCERFRLIYDCSADGCQGKEHTSRVCRACTLCIQRCFKCGRCIVDGEYEETFCLDWLCSFCKRGEHLVEADPDPPSTS